MDPRSSRYSGVAILLHWVVAAGVLGMFPFGVYMHDLGLSPLKIRLFNYHKWAGVTVFAIVAIRLGWRLFHQPPQFPPNMRISERRLAALAHGALYVLLFSIPISGWLMSSALGYQTVWFGLAPIPDLIERDKALAAQLLLVHQTLNLSLAILIVMHILAALRHHFVLHDDVLSRMLWPVRKTADQGRSERD